MQKKSENVAHAQDGIKLGKLKNSGPLVEFATDRGIPVLFQNAIELQVHDARASLVTELLANPSTSAPSIDLTIVVGMRRYLSTKRSHYEIR